jgi:basic membrane protein A
MKKLLALLLALVMVVGLMACGAKAPEKTPTTSDPTGTSETPVIKVGLMLEGALGDESINDQAYEGLKLVAETFGVETKYVECDDSSMYVDYIEGMIAAGYNVICCDSFNHEAALREVAPKYPDVHFMILDTEVSDIPNVASFTYATHECSYLAGIAAAMKSETNVIAFIGGMQIPTIEKFQVGFEEGVHSVNPDATVLVKYIGNDNSAWNDPATAKTLSLDCIANGADVLYHAAGASGMGMIEACVENNLWAIGVNIDQAHLAPEHMLTSALTKGDRAVYLFAESCINGAPLSGMTVLNCANEGVGVVDSEFMTDEIMAAINEAASKIVSGELVVTNVMDY